MYKNELVLNPVGGGPPRNPKKEVVGRDIFVEQMIERLEYTSIQMFAPRRLGKSWVLKLLEVKAPSSVMAVYMDLEGSHSTYEFVENVATAFNFAGKRLGAAVGKILEDFSIGHLKAVGHKFPWKEHLDGIFQKLDSQKKPVWLLMDEFPLFLMNLANNEEAKTATKILDYFRYVRQNYKNIRFVLTGSIGLHWVVKDLEATGWRNPQNDDTKMTLEPLELREATRRRRHYLEGLEKAWPPPKHLPLLWKGTRSIYKRLFKTGARENVVKRWLIFVLGLHARRTTRLSLPIWINVWEAILAEAGLLPKVFWICWLRRRTFPLTRSVTYYLVSAKRLMKF